MKRKSRKSKLEGFGTYIKEVGKRKAWQEEEGS